ncbi:MAG: AraC family transcriptional regulator [Planctomycetales bacterium]|nr:AraC family transcriptional regulator [Planctomycetales bacterium]
MAAPGDEYPATNHPNLYNFKWCAGRVLPEHQLLLLTNAQGEFESEQTGLVRFHGHALIYLFPGVWHRYRPLRNSGWTERWVSLDGPAIGSLLQQGGVTPQQAITEPTSSTLLEKGFDQLIQAVRRPLHPHSSPAPLVLNLLTEAIEQTTHVRIRKEDIVASEAEKVSDEVVQAALDIIWNDTHSPPLGVSDVAKMLPVTRRTLDRRFSETLGRSVLEEINACRFARAQRLLRETNLPIKSVSYLAGFPSRERMRIMFLEREGLPPRDYRDRVQTQRNN